MDIMDIARRKERPAHRVFSAGFYGGSWDHDVRSVLGKAPRGGADVGEVLSTIAAVEPHDTEAWPTAWIALGDRVGAVAARAAERGHRVSAARAHLRAANYLAVAVNALAGRTDAEDRLQAVFRRHRAEWDGFTAQSGWDVRVLDLPYGDGTMPGLLFRPDAAGSPRPTLVMVNGSDGSISGLWCEGAEGALERGYNVLLFDGPGQQSMLLDQGVVFRPDWEAVLTPVVDVLLGRDDTDPAAVVAYGISQGGYWLPRALAFEHRFAAAAVDGGVVDVSRSWWAHIPDSLRKAYDKGEKEKFDRDMALGFKLPGGKAAERTWAFRARPYGTRGYAETLDAVSAYSLTDALCARIETPLFVAAPHNEEFFPGQSQELAAAVPGAEPVEFTAAEGADRHCQPLARELTEQRVFDWMDERLGR
ncbi:alpha/beta hydrolase family protein [Streptomonospora litoralis]|uniref:Alpha/beta hydrolase family protein n=1 Tax=Streptomonospora litoralis TaxID=2498135 RepID=A0A4P6PZ10_9ACTN|nr:dipeptidyl aminopeptidase [Streptomonospora litoralis]QBI53488.1 Alpha/beta hydrolase family protein [Streptomonospora litoralis]